MTTDKEQRINGNGQRLTMRISQNSLSFSTLNGREVLFECYPLKNSISLAANLREALRQMPLLQDNYQRVTVLTDSPILLVPTNLFQEEDKELLYRHTFTGQEQRMILYSVVTDLNAVAVFSIQKDLRQVITDRFSQTTFVPLMAPVWRHLHQKSFTGNHAKLYGYAHDHRLEVFNFSQNRFKFYNAYTVNNADDALYYLLAVWKQIGMNPQDDEMHLSGDLPEKDQLLEKARQYVKRVFINNPAGEFNRLPISMIEGMPYDMMLYYLKGR